MVKTVSDKQLSEKIKELLKNAEVDESVITEVVAEINDNDDNTDADGDKVDLQDSDKETEGEGTETEGQSDEGDDNDDKGDSDDNEVEDEEDDDGGEDDEGDDNSDDSDDESDKDEEEDEKGDEDDKDDVGEEDIGDDEVEANPLAMLEDPKFRQGFDLGYKFRFEMEKLEKMEVGDEDPEEEDEKEEESDEPKEEVKDSDKDEKDEDEEEKSIIAQDSVEKIKQQVTAEVTASFKSRMEAGAKVKPLVGTISDVMAFDSAEEIYGFALKQNGVDVSKYKKDAYAGMVDMMLQKNEDQKVNLVIGDSVPQGTFGKQIDGAFARLKNIAN